MTRTAGTKGTVTKGTVTTSSWSVVFPRRWSLAGVVIAGLFAGGLGAWVLRSLASSRAGSPDGGPADVPWLALVLALGMVAVCLLSLRQLIAPWRQVDVSPDGLLVRRRGRRGETFIAWHDVLAVDYREHDDRSAGQSVRHKVARLRLREGARQPTPPRFFDDAPDIVHLDAFAASPGGAELASRLERARGGAVDAAAERA